jgi:cation diffusion facilitator CzcD-associated flavoprotein CzcO
MEPLESTDHDSSSPPTVGNASEVDVLVVGAGILGIYQLYLAREEGFSVLMFEAGEGVGGTWYWNRYPEARVDSESYAYAYVFSEELFDDWYWTEHFAGQPENERYLNHVVDRFDLRRHIRFGTRVTSTLWDEASGAWTVRAEDGTEARARFVVSTTGVLSIPYYPDVPGRGNFRGEAYHTGQWPKEPLDFRGKRVAVVGTGSSGVQVIPAIAEDVASLTVYQRTPNWCTPLNNRPITREEQEDLRANFESIRQTLLTSIAGFLHVPYDRTAFEETREQRLDHYEKMWNSQGFKKLSENYTDLLTNKEVNSEFCEFISNKIRSIVKDPVTAEKLIPKDHGYAGKRPPFGSGYYEAYNNSKVSLVDLNETPMERVTETGIETTDGLREFDIIVWATGFDFGTGALSRMGVRGRKGLALMDHWADGPRTFLGIQTNNFPNFFFPGGPHGAAGNNPRYGGDQVEYVMKTILYMREHGYRIVDVPAESEEAWTSMVYSNANRSPFLESSYFFGSNIPGKVRRFLLNPLGKPKMMEMMNEVVENDYKGFLENGDGQREDRQ